MIAIRDFLRTLRKDTRGATAIEYGLIACFLGTGLIGSLKLLGGGTDGMWTRIVNILDGALL